MNSSQRELLIICDSSPLILLAKVDQLGLFRAMADEVWIPAAVWAEVVVKGAGRPEAAMVAAQFAGAIRQPDAELEAAFRFQVDSGEAAALALAARNRDACLLMDDARGRALAGFNQFRCIGTLGWLVRAKRTGHLPALRPVFEHLRREGWFIDERLLHQALVAAGES
jgi:predicted nucleic acid-binding protein